MTKKTKITLIIMGAVISFGKQDVWITFDDRVTSNVVGYDIIKQLTRASIGGFQRKRGLPAAR